MGGKVVVQGVCLSSHRRGQSGLLGASGFPLAQGLVWCALLRIVEKVEPHARRQEEEEERAGEGGVKE